MKCIVEGEFHISDQTGKKVIGLPGDVFCESRPSLVLSSLLYSNIQVEFRIIASTWVGRDCSVALRN